MDLIPLPSKSGSQACWKNGVRPSIPSVEWKRYWVHLLVGHTWTSLPAPSDDEDEDIDERRAPGEMETGRGPEVPQMTSFWTRIEPWPPRWEADD
jgi:hypothetical protein